MDEVGQKTALYDTHIALGAKIVSFSGFLMPLQYSGIIDEHNSVRNSVGLFDLSHMGEFTVSGKDSMSFLQRMTINDLSRVCLLYTSPSPRDLSTSRMPSSA